MAEALKNIYDSSYIDRLGDSFKLIHPQFNQTRFKDLVLYGNWEELELKQRVSRICTSIHTVLELPFEEACKILKIVAKDFGGYAALYFPEYVQHYGLSEEHWNTAMETLAVLTQYSSAEFAIRPFIKMNPNLAMEQMLQWSTHENDHIRRLASEGCRPRLPWASALVDFKKDPTPILGILENLKDDSSLYVRKSVANNLNDISKDHPRLALKIGKSWMSNPSPECQWIVKHGLRTLLKSSEAQALELFGLGNSRCIEFYNFQLHSPMVSMGEKLSFQFDLDIKEATKLRIEYALHFKKKSGQYGRKVFKLSEIEVEAGDYEVTKDHLFKELTTRSFNEGVHFLEIIVNGKSFKIVPFYLSLEVQSDYYIYMIYTSKNTIYTGITTDPSRRFSEHSSSKKGAKYTRAFHPLGIIYLEGAANRSCAQKRESVIKKLSRSQKEALSGHKLSIFKDKIN